MRSNTSLGKAAGYRVHVLTHGTAYHVKVIRPWLVRTALLALAVPLIAFSQSSPPSLRLPSSVEPVRYAADLNLVPGQDHFSATVNISLRVREPVSTVWLHSKSLQIASASIRSGGSDLSAKVDDADNDLAGITATKPLDTGDAVLTIAYTGDLSRTLTDGAFQQQQGNDWYIFTKFEPITARRVFPCFDEPSFKTPWQLRLHVPSRLQAFSNTSVVSETPESNGQKAVLFQETKPLPSYLVAFAVGPFDIVPTEPVGSNHRPSRIIVPHGRSSEAVYAASITPKLIQLLEGYFGSPYPYEKLDQVVVPLTTAWGAMENAGLIAYGDFLLAPKQQDSELRQRSRASTMEHEMSHQWFGDLVTTAWWDDIWLNEAFASWLSTKLLDEWKPEWQLKSDNARSLTVFHADSLTSSRKIRQPIQSPGDIGIAFDGITYGKGEAVINMFEDFVGALKFQAAIRAYLKQHAWGNATSSDLMASIDSVAGPGIGAAFSTFLNQTGFPLISATVRCDRPQARVHLVQKRFLPLGSEGEANATWNVPVCVRWSDSAGLHRQCMLLTREADDFALESAKSCPAWLFADANAAGYYGVLYQPPYDQRLIQQGVSKLSDDEKADALRNIQLEFSSGLGNLDQQLQFVVDFSHSSDPGLERQTASTIASLDEQTHEGDRQKYAAVIRNLYGARAHELGWKSQPGESQETRLLRIAILPLVATSGGDADLKAQAAQLAKQWLGNRSALDADMVVPVLSTVAWSGDRAFFNQLVDETKHTKVQRERLWMISAVKQFRDPEIVRSGLGLLFDSGIDPRELSTLLLEPPTTSREVVWSFVQQNFDRINTLLPGARGVPFGATLPRAASGFCDSEHASQVQSFFESRIGQMPGGPRNLANALERIRLCTARATVAEPAIQDFLSRQ